jgi:hypothetical protein
MPDSSIPWHPEAFAALSMSAAERAFWNDQASFAIKYTAIHAIPPGLSEAQISQRKAILDIAAQMLIAERDKAMDEACAQWRDYRASAR